MVFQGLSEISPLVPNLQRICFWYDHHHFDFMARYDFNRVSLELCFGFLKRLLDLRSHFHGVEIKIGDSEGVNKATKYGIPEEVVIVGRRHP